MKTRSLCLVVLLVGCRLEDHTPAGSRRDEAQIRGVITEYYRSFSERNWSESRRFFMDRGMVSYESGMVPVDSVYQWFDVLERRGGFPSPQNQVLRLDLRQADGYAAAWVTVQQIVPRHGRPDVSIGEDVEHWVLQRTPEGWRIVLLTLPWLSH